MFLKIKNKIDQELFYYIQDVDKLYRLSSISSLLYKSIKEFISRPGKRVRPTLFVIGYLGYSKKTAPRLYRSAIAIELLHDFMLVHDDIIDKSDTRRGKPSMHELFNKYLCNKKNIKFNGQDLSIIAGDVMYAMALDAFLAVKENPANKEAAFKKLIEAAFYTGSGEFIELLYAAESIDKISQEGIYKIYDLKTANYTFATPLVMGATLAGANKNQISKLYRFGIYLGRAFQIQDDILGTFSEQKEIGKSNITDIQEAKKTILIWYAYNHTEYKNKKIIKDIFSGNSVSKQDLLRIRRIISSSGSLDYAKNEITSLVNKAKTINQSLKISSQYKEILFDFSKKMLGL
ncbi:MAG: polyprenyl synthetase family protein [Candidatus Omnitrophica bacterium]|nr:polyprenyl synthetase family protein [Candidatus Omnitrophota bacterium]